MKKILLGLWLSLLTLLCVRPAQAAEMVTAFDTEITVNADTSLSITETIHYQTDEEVEKHGIYRYIPVRYNRGDGWNYRTAVSEFKVTDEQGRSHPFSRSYENGNVTLKIGDPDKTFTGPRTYIISYRVHNAVQDSDGVHSLVWDITGEGWVFPVASTSARLTSPSAQLQSLDCYSGEFGSDDGRCRIAEQDTESVLFVYPYPISYGENMTIDAVFVQPNQLIFPTPTEKLWKAFWDNIGIGLLSLPGLLMFGWWWKKGRDFVFTSANVFNLDPKQPQTRASLIGGSRTPFVYEPLKDLTPGEAGVMLDERADNEDVIAELLELAHRKYLSIKREESKGFFSTTVDYVFKQLKTSDSHLSEAQAYLHDALFKNRETVKLSTLKGTFYTEMSKVKSLLNKSLSERGLFVGNPEHQRWLGMGAAIVLDGLAFIGLMTQIEQGIYWGVPIFILSGLVALACGWNMVAKSAVGSNLSAQARGLRETINRGAWREKIKEKNLFIENVLPFAVSLGVINQLSRDMEKMNLKPPQYVSSGMTQHMAMSSFMNSFSSQAAAGMSYNPSSSSSGGGGSGGGGGGGGGGSW